MYDALHLVSQFFKGEVGTLNQLQDQLKEKLDSMSKESKEESREEKERLEGKLKDALIGKAEAEASGQFLKE